MEYKYGNAIIRVRGEIDRKKIEDATIIFFKKVNTYRRNKDKEKRNIGNDDTSRAV